MELAPIVLFVYNRPNHTRKTLEALEKNEQAKLSILYIYADGVKEGANNQEQTMVNEVRDIIYDNWNFKKINIVQREKNWGLAANIVDGVTKIINEFGRIIVLEDDIVVSSTFLKFINDSLIRFENNNNIAGISGYTYYSEDGFPDCFLLPISCSWSWATWKRVWSNYNHDVNSYLEKIQKRKRRFDFGNYPFHDLLQRQITIESTSWAIRFYASIFLQNQHFVYPKKSLVSNIGFNAGATHTKKEDDFFSVVKASDNHYDCENPLYNKYVIKKTKRHFETKFKRYGIFDKIKKKIKIWVLKAFSLRNY